MPYHALAVEQQWHELDIKFQTLILALMRVAGGGFLATGTATISLIIVYLITKEPWSLLMIPSISFITSLSSLYATLLVKTRTPGLPPVKLSKVSIGLVIIGFVLSLFGFIV